MLLDELQYYFVVSMHRAINAGTNYHRPNVGDGLHASLFFSPLVRIHVQLLCESYSYLATQNFEPFRLCRRKRRYNDVKEKQRSITISSRRNITCSTRHNLNHQQDARKDIKSL